MSRTSWRAPLKKALSRPTATDAGLRLAVLGIGNSTRGDDGAGSLAARLVQRGLSLANPGQFLVIDAGPAPENFSGVLRKFKPDFVLMVDAVQGESGDARIRWIDPANVGGVTAMTHGLPLTVLGDFLASELGTGYGLLGITGENFEPGKGLSLNVGRAVRRAAGEIRKLLQELDQENTSLR